MTAKQLTRIGVFHIEEAILDTLLQADEEYLTATNLAQDLGIKVWDKSNWTITGILYKLETDQRIEARRTPSGKRSGWKLTTRERNRRND